MRYPILIAVLLLLIVNTAPAQQSAADANSSSNTVQTPDKETGPVAVPPMSVRAAQYYKSGCVLWFVNTFWALLIPILFLFTGFSARIRNWAQKIGRKWFFVIAVYFIIFSILNFLIDLPLSYYEDFVREHAYGLSNQTFSKWFGDSLKGLLVGLIFGSLFLWVPYLLLKKSPKRWWVYTGLLSIPFLFFVMLISPIWIDPLFNKFGPMKNKELERSILALADRAGIEGGRVYEVNKSEDTKTVNAYVTGFMGTKRIVLWDTTLAKLNEKEILFVMGHEMGHYVLHHVIWGILFFSILILITLYVAYRTAGGLIRKYHNRFGFEDLSDIASLPLILLLISLFSLIITPIAFSFTRYQEHEADRFGLEITQDNHAAGTSFVKLQQENLSNPRPGILSKLWRSSHPTLGERIDFSNEYRPWKKGEPLKYGDKIRK
jgi:STE24 endopeptidase